MISSEVQRTLVKSPPELWAEISDPASLARHLGEFGEIRITRVEPEQRVEWEAGDTSGSVVIKPSGWGTKVKLTVTRELAQLEDTADTASDDSADDGAQVEADAAADAREPDASRGPSRELDARRRPTRRHEVEAPRRAEHPEPTPEDARARGRRAQRGEPRSELEPARARGARAARTPSPSRPDPSRRESRVRQPSPELEPRRGFLRSTVRPPTWSAAIEPAPTSRARGRRRGRAARRPERADAPATSDSNALAVWASQIEPDGRDDDAWERCRAPGRARSRARARARCLATRGRPTCPRRRASISARPDEEASADAAWPGDISAEIAAAEEVAAEEVTAVLTGVLDRLGAAHHRPFSRS